MSKLQWAILIVLAFLLASISACSTSKKPEPILIKPACPAVISAEIRPEPIAPPEAIANDVARDFMAIEWLPWARDNARRLSEARAWCLRGAK
jgi:hypothetical protein